MPHIELDDVQLYYETHGQPREDERAPLILIPGFGTGAWIWFRQVEALARDFQVVTFDPRGVARSTAPDAPFSIKTIAGDLAAMLDKLNIEEAHILGASFGGFVAQEFALGYPQKTKSLILCCTSFGGARHVAPSPETLAALASTRGLNTEDRVRENLLLAFSPRFIRSHPEIVEQVIHLRAANFVPEITYLHQLQAAMNFDTEKRIKFIKAPTLIITGDADIIVPALNSHRLAEHLPLAELTIIENGSHIFFIEQADEFNRVVLEFLDRATTT
ncbi:MAG: alpha/beta hydrolase [Pyrinomonadaceae bacterium MAG19_C2-C3]|nr:alpha/beta hydrolase [Pyrinomonadaceae bacterium MAG19_C2-C3]